jgi:hypothetical protein
MKAIRIVLALLIFAAAFPMVSEARITSCYNSSVQDHDPSPIGGGGSSGGGGC